MKTEPITFAVYHTDMTEKGIDILLDKLPLMRTQKWEQYLSLSKNCIYTLFESIKAIHPNARFVIMTDLNTSFEPPKNIQLLRFNVDQNQPAYARLCAQIEYLEKYMTSNVIFIDYDMLVQHDLSPIFEKIFDIGFTYRLYYGKNYSPCPINGALIFVPNNHKKALEFLKLVKKMYDTNYSNHREWGGFQGAVNDVVEDETIFFKQSDIVTKHDTKILLLPVEEYNFTMENTKSLDYLPDKKILHFKGPRKEAMFDYWNEYLKPRA